MTDDTALTNEERQYLERLGLHTKGTALQYLSLRQVDSLADKLILDPLYDKLATAGFDFDKRMEG